MSYRLNKTGAQINTSLAKADTALQPNAAITGATKTKITYDTKGLVTGGADLTANDIPTLDVSKITGAERTSNKVTTVTAQSTDTQYPSAKCVYDVGTYLGGEITTLQGQVTTLESGKVNKATGTPTLFALGKDSTGIFIELGD